MTKVNWIVGEGTLYVYLGVYVKDRCFDEYYDLGGIVCGFSIDWLHRSRTWQGFAHIALHTLSIVLQDTNLIHSHFI
jgi:hypothetical protein